jgi:3-hydroxyisobutyrate dehydrogenase-like beta-hydroxyacid dehydrogenase
MLGSSENCRGIRSSNYPSSPAQTTNIPRFLLLSPAFTVEQMINDFNIIIDTARNDHVPMFVAALIRQQYEAAQVEGNAGRDFFVLCEAGRRH